MSSREKPNVSCVRSLVPNEKNCAFGGDLVGRQRAARHLDHRADEVLDLDALLLHDVRRHAIDDGLLIAQLLHVADERDHDLGHDLRAFLRELTGRLDDRARLHLGDLGIGDAETDAAMPEHRVELVQLLDPPEQRLLLLELLALLALHFHLRDLDHQVLALRQELVERRIDRADRDRRAVHRLEHAVEVAALQRQQLVERLARRSASLSARIIRCTIGIRPSPKNMCSVRHRPMPRAPNA